MTIDDKLITYLENLSCIKLTDEERRRMPGDLSKILGYIAHLGELDTENVRELSHSFDNVNVFRDDIVKASFDRELILKNAPSRTDEMFVAPKTVE